MRNKLLLIPGIISLLLTGIFSSCSENKTPYWLTEYESVYGEDPNLAARMWFSEARFGMFVHLNLASLCEYGKSDYLEWTDGNASDRLLDFIGVNRGDYEKSGNKDSLLFTRYKLENFDADAICRLASDAGMKYVTFTTQHLGRCFNFDTKVSSFSSPNAPAGRDLVKEMASACKKYGMPLFLYLPPEYARTDPERRDINIQVITELLTAYGPVGGIWFDGIGDFYRAPENYTRLSETFALIRSLQPHCLISFKEGAIGGEDFISPEHFMLPFPYEFDTPGRQERYNIRMERWTGKNENQARWDSTFRNKLREVNTVMQYCMGRDGLHVPSGWINDESAVHLSAEQVYYWLEYASYTGSNMLMNIGPRADGSVHPDDMDALRKVGLLIEEKGFPEIQNKVTL